MNAIVSTVRSYSLLLVLAFLPGFPLWAQQLEVNNAPPITPENLITNVFLGEGVEVLDIQFDGASSAVGFFQNAGQQIGLERGIVMSTGLAASNAFSIGVDAAGFQQSSFSPSGPAVDPDMLQISEGVALHDMVKYEITFVPISDTLRFRYVFASEEYPEYVCSDFNDIFGFFISGPGINGPFSNNAKNIALIPGTELPVTINNLNPGVVGTQEANIINCTPPEGSLAFSEFYNSNNFSDQRPVYDGFTDVLVAEAVVVPCSTYTIKMVIVDIFDELFDSGVFLEAKSFGTGSLDAEAYTVSLDGSVAEGCAEGQLVFSLPSRAEADYPIDYTIFGTAENGVDYQSIPPGLFIPAGDSLLSIPIIAFEDGLDEGEEMLYIDVQRDACTRDTIAIPIRERPLIERVLEADTSLCPGESAILDGTLDIPIPDAPSFIRNEFLAVAPFNTTVYSEIEVSGVFPEDLGPGVIQSVCIEELTTNWADDLRIFLISPGGQFLELVTDIGNGGDDFIGTCFTPQANTPITSVTEADAPFTGEFAPEGLWEDLYGPGRPTNGTWQLALSDKFFADIPILNSWSITFAPPYSVQYHWEPADGLSCQDCPDPVASPSAPATYVLSISDSYGCQTADTVNVDLITSLQAPQLQCASTGNNSVTINWPQVPGASGYEVNVNGAGWVPANGTLQHTVGGLGIGEEVSFEVRATGSCGGETATISCTALDCSPPALELLSIQGASCAGSADGQVELSASGGQPPYEFTVNGNTNSSGTFTGLPAGDYSAQVADQEGCPASLNFTIGQPEAISLTPLTSSISCNGSADGTATVQISGGSGPYAFNWGNGQQDSIATGLSAGPLSLVVTDGNGCQADIEVNVTEPSPITLELSGEGPSCFEGSDGMASVEATGGFGGFTYSWSNSQSSAEATGLSAGSVAVIVIDDNGCVAEDSIHLEEPERLTGILSTEPTSCKPQPDGSASISVSGGTSPYAYAWSDTQDQATAQGLGIGTYFVTVTDANACTLVDTAGIVGIPDFSLSLEAEGVSCNGDSDGAVQVTVEGGEPGMAYTYNWSGGLPNAAALDGIPAGQYTVTVTDEIGCTVVDSVAVSEPAALGMSFDATPTSCSGGDDGSISLFIGGGVFPYSVLWNTGDTTEALQELPAGAYSAEITDANGCTGSVEVTVPEANPIELEAEVQGVDCFGESSGSAALSVRGGRPPYTYRWPDGSAAASRDGLRAGSYSLTVTDTEGCERMEEVVIPGPEEALGAEIEAPPVSCFGRKDGRIQISPSGGTPPYLFSLDGEFFSGNGTFIGLEAGEYNAIVKDNNGCIFRSADIEVLEPGEIIVDLGENSSVRYGDTIRLEAEISGGAPPFGYDWSPMDSTILSCFGCSAPLAFINFQVSVKVVVTDQNGCTGEDIVTLYARKDRKVFVPSGFTPNGDGNNDRLVVHARNDVEMEVLYFKVYDRWGELVFENKNFAPNEPQSGWDGRFRGQPLQGGVYIWHVGVRYDDGMEEEFTGGATLVR